MSEESPPGPPGPPPPRKGSPNPASSAQRADADTPRDGLPAFGDTPVDGPPTFGDTGEVPLVAPSPDHASSYVPPREIPKPADHKTIDVSPIRISPDADPRRAMTQKAMHVIKREEAQRHLLLMGVDATAATPNARAPQASESEGESGTKSKAGLFIGGAIAVLVIAAGGFVAFKMVNPEPAAEAIPSSTSPPSPTTTSPSHPAMASAPATAVEPAPQPSAEPAPTAAPTGAPTAAPTPSTPSTPSTIPSTTGRKKKPNEDTPKPINE